MSQRSSSRTSRQAVQVMIGENVQNGATTTAAASQASLLGPYVNDSMGLKSVDVVKEFVTLMKDVKDMTKRLIMLMALLKTPEDDILSSFIETKGGHVLRVWLVEATKENSPLLTKILEVLDHLPMGKESLKATALGKAVNSRLLKTSTVEGVAKMAEAILEKWKRRVGEEEASETERLRTNVASASGTISEDPRLRVTDAMGSSGSDLGRRNNAVRPPPKPRPPQAPNVQKGVQKGASVPNTSFFDEIFAAQSSLKTTKSPQPAVASWGAARPARDTATSFKSPENATESNVKTEQTPASMGASSDLAAQPIGEDATAMDVVPTKKRKRVSFAPDDQLRQVKFYELEEPEGDEEISSAIETPHQFGNARDLERNEGLGAFKRQRISPSIEWYPPPEIDLDGIRMSTIHSPEAERLAEIQKHMLEESYINASQIPDSPKEPIEPPKEPEVVEIPVYDLAEPMQVDGQPEASTNQRRYPVEFLELLNQISQTHRVAALNNASTDLAPPQNPVLPNINPINMVGLDVHTIMGGMTGVTVAAATNNPVSMPPQFVSMPQFPSQMPPSQPPPPPPPPSSQSMPPHPPSGQGGDWNMHDPNRGGVITPFKPMPSHLHDIQHGMLTQPPSGPPVATGQQPPLPPPQMPPYGGPPSHHMQPHHQQMPFRDIRKKPNRLHQTGGPRLAKKQVKCRYYLSGRCKKPNCEFLHDGEPST